MLGDEWVKVMRYLVSTLSVVKTFISSYKNALPFADNYAIPIALNSWYIFPATFIAANYTVSLKWGRNSFFQSTLIVLSSRFKFYLSKRLPRDFQEWCLGVFRTTSGKQATSLNNKHLDHLSFFSFCTLLAFQCSDLREHFLQGPFTPWGLLVTSLVYLCAL